MEAMKILVKWLTEILQPQVILSSILVASLSFIFFTPHAVLIIAGIWLSSYGILDYVFRNSKSILDIRSKPAYKPNIIFNAPFRIDGSGYVDEVIKKIDYCGFRFIIMGVKQEPLILRGLSNPLCPSCEGNLITFSGVKFPSCVSIRFFCNSCDTFYKSKKTREELIKEVSEINGIIPR
jgi:hypothetical protein